MTRKPSKPPKTSTERHRKHLTTHVPIYFTLDRQRANKLKAYLERTNLRRSAFFNQVIDGLPE